MDIYTFLALIAILSVLLGISQKKQTQVHAIITSQQLLDLIRQNPDAVLVQSEDGKSLIRINGYMFVCTERFTSVERLAIPEGAKIQKVKAIAGI
jgi:hypothetical protein